MHSNAEATTEKALWKALAPSMLLRKAPTVVFLVSCFRMQLFCLQLEASCLQWSVLLTIDSFGFFTYSWNFFPDSFSFPTYSWSFLLTVGNCV